MRKDLGPAGPEAAKGGPEEAVARIQGRPRTLSFEHGELLAQSEDLDGCVASRTKENAECTQYNEEKLDHKLTVVARAANSMPMSVQTVDFTMR
jgi:hypothetical protein